MKRFLLIVLLLTYFLSMSAQQVQINGKLLNYKTSDNDSISLLIHSSPREPIVIKAPISKKGTFSFSYIENSTNYCELFISQQDKCPLFLTTGEKVSFTAEYSDIAHGEIKGSKQTTAMKENIARIQQYMIEEDSIKKEFEKTINTIEKEKKESIADAIRQNPSMLSNLSILNILPIDEYTDVYQMLDSILTQVYPTNAIVKDYHENFAKMMILREGTVMPDIILTDNAGSTQKLSSLKGDIVLVDFWASWCRPCRMEIPNLKKIYEAYNNQGFSIYSVSVDNDVAAWYKALNQENMPWINVRDDNNVYSTMFNVSSIPFTILLDREGKIIAKGLRGADLEERVQNLVKKPYKK